MKSRQLGSLGPNVSAIGLGCMGMSFAYGPASEEAAVATLQRALDLGVSFFDTAEIYGPYTNERLVGAALRGRRDEAVIATKFGFAITGGEITGVDSRPENVRAVAEASLQRLGVDHIDLFYQHRVDPAVPIEETVGAMAELVRQGKVRHLGLSEASAATIRRAHAVHPIAAVQSEYSLWSRDPEDEVLPACRDLGIAFVPYSPLGRGLLTGGVKARADLAADDWRRTLPRFQDENLARNLGIVEALGLIAAEKGATPAQLALAWLLHQGDDIIPIPGARKVRHLEENAAAADIALTAEEIGRIEAAAGGDAVAGARYNPHELSFVNL